MKPLALLAAAVVLLANALALVHAARNRAGTPTAEVTLSDRELSYRPRADDSTVRLDLRWRSSGTGAVRAGRFVRADALDLDAAQLAGLGFDVSLAPDAEGAARFYGRQAPRVAYVAFEVDGPAWQARLRATEKELAEAAGSAHAEIEKRLESEKHASRLLAIEAGVDAAALRARYAGRKDVFVLPAIIALRHEPRFADAAAHTTQPARIYGALGEVPADVHVPRPYSDAFRRYQRLVKPEGRAGELYRVRLRFGQLGEPWVVGVEFPFEADPR